MTPESLAQEAAQFPASQMQVNKVFGKRPSDPNIYTFVGTGFILGIRTDNADQAVARWIETHPAAMVTPESTMNGGRIGPLVYAWITDGDENMQVSLVREGDFPGGGMVDPVQYLTSIQSISHIGPDSPDFPKRLVSDEAYRAFMERVIEAEIAARQDRRGSGPNGTGHCARNRACGDRGQAEVSGTQISLRLHWSFHGDTP